jgi:hypothetical protein
MNKHLLAFVILFFMSNSWAQDETRKALRGKIVSDASELEGIYILNMNTEKVALTESGGYFSIMAKEGDSLMLSSIQIKGEIITLAAADFEKDLFFTKVEAMVHALDEVKIVRYENLNAFSLGIVQKKPKTYTPAERRLLTAGDLKPTDFLGLLGGGMQADPIINAISGRTAMLKKQVDAERKEYLMAYISNMFEDEYFIEKLKIPVEYVRGFLYYIVENERFVAAVKAKNKTMSDFLMGELAVKFKDTIACEGQ